jgi:hypothetical protein
MTLSLGKTNLRFLTPSIDLKKYLQAVFGGCTGVIRTQGLATVASGQTTVTVADTGIAAGDIVNVSLMVKGTNACVVNSVVITAATNFVITVSTDPGTGGAVFAYTVTRPVP